MSLSRRLLSVLALCAVFFAASAARADDDFLDPAIAFQVSARALADKKVELTYKVAKGYYLYRERFKFASPDAKLGPAQIPAGLRKFDAALEQNVEIYHDKVVVVLPVLSAPATFTLNATHQGCAEKGLCYPPQPRVLKISMKAFGAPADDAVVTAAADGDSGGGGAGPGAPAVAQSSMSVAPAAQGVGSTLRQSVLGGSPATADGAGGTPDGAPAAATSVDTGASAANPVPASVQAARATDPSPADADDSRLATALHGGNLWVILPLALGLGLLLSMTPCVWPMLPILSSIIVGQGERVTPMRGLALSATYSLGMALVYTALGVAAGLAGQGLAAFLQSPTVLVTFGLLLAVLSLSMFGVYELQLPARWRDSLNARNQALSGGQLGGVLGMGVLSALIVSPCVSAPLAGALLYISQTRDGVLGGAALFAMALGMSVPLMIVGTSAGTLLPRSGAWMDRVKQLFGLMLLGVAIYIVQPVLPGLASMIAWGLLLLLGASSLGAFEAVQAGPHQGTARLFKGFALVLALLGVLQFVGIASGGRDPAQPLASFAQARAHGAGTATADAGAAQARFERVASVEELDQRLQAAGRPVLLDFYADWCVSCKEMEKFTFVDPRVQARLAHAVLLRADVTANSTADRALLKRFSLFGPPGLIFFDAQGHELQRPRVIGFQDSDRFATTLGAAGL